jgi:hypothetical protein
MTAVWNRFPTDTSRGTRPEPSTCLDLGPFMAIADVAQYAHSTAIDLEALSAELDAIRCDVEESRGARDAASIRRTIACQRGPGCRCAVTHRAGTQQEKRSQSRAPMKKIARQPVKDYLLFPALSGARWRLTLGANVPANVVRNLWAHVVIFCGHFQDAGRGGLNPLCRGLLDRCGVQRRSGVEPTSRSISAKMPGRSSGSLIRRRATSVRCTPWERAWRRSRAKACGMGISKCSRR